MRTETFCQTPRQLNFGEGGGRCGARVPKNSLTMAAEPRRVMMSLDAVRDAILVSSPLLLLVTPLAAAPRILRRGLLLGNGNGKGKGEATASAAAAAQCGVGMGDVRSRGFFFGAFSNGSTGSGVWMDACARWWTGAGAFKGGPDRRAQRSCGCGPHALDSDVATRPKCFSFYKLHCPFIY